MASQVNAEKPEGQILPDVATKAPIGDEEKGPVATTGPPDTKDLPSWHPLNNPDGGRQAWLCVVGAFACLYVFILEKGTPDGADMSSDSSHLAGSIPSEYSRLTTRLTSCATTRLQRSPGFRLSKPL